jgi:hypothetical protein
MIYPSEMSKTERQLHQQRERRLAEDAKRYPERPPPKDPLYVDLVEAARVLHCSVSHVRRLCDKGKLGCIVKHWRHRYFTRRCRLIPKAEVMRYVLEHMSKTRKPPTRKGAPQARSDHADRERRA